MVPVLQIRIDFETGRILRYTVYIGKPGIAYSLGSEKSLVFSMPPLAQSQHFTENARSQHGMLGHYMVNLQMSWP